VIANGGVSVVTAILVEPAGTFAPDGTEVFFFTSLGRVDASGKTTNGVARVNFVSDTRSGLALVTAISGGPAQAPPAAETRSGVTASAAGVTATAAAVGVSAVAVAGVNFATIEISIGSNLPKVVLVSANPPVLASSRQAAITANVFDEFGNPVQNVPVIFSVTAAPLQEFLSSGGSPQYTDSNGQAFDTLTTRAPNGTDQKEVTVTATIPVGNLSNFVIIAVNTTAAP
jgi:hypothetical protein